MEDFARRFDLALDYQRYLASKGIYAEDGDRCYWEPTDWTDLEPIEANYGPGAMRKGELSDWTPDGIEEF